MKNIGGMKEMNKHEERPEVEDIKREIHRGMRSHHQRMPDPEKIREILDVVSEKVPGLLKELSGLLYGPESAKNYAASAATFFKELRDAGMTEEQAFELTQQYMSSLNLGHFAKGFAHHHE
jgi:hypothetical protein